MMQENQAYRNFLVSLGIEEISWHFPIKDEKKYDKTISRFLDSLAISFFDLNDKKELYIQAISDNFSEDTFFKISLLMEENYSKIRERYPINKVVMEKLIKYLIDWIFVIDNELTEEHIKQTLKNIKTKNESFWFSFLKELYNRGYYKETLLVIAKKKKLFQKTYLLEDVVLKEIECIRKDIDYLYNMVSLKRLCILSKDIKNYRYVLIILVLECALLSQNKEQFENIYYQYFDEIQDFELIKILNVYELAILSKSKKVYIDTNKLLNASDIELYNGHYEYKIYLMLEYLHDNKLEKVRNFRSELENNYEYDFRHIDWFLKRSQNQREC